MECVWVHIYGCMRVYICMLNEWNGQTNISTRKYCFNKNILCPVHCAHRWHEENMKNMNRTVHTNTRTQNYCKHQNQIHIQCECKCVVVVFHFHSFFFYCYCCCSMLYVCVCSVFVIFSLNVHFICLEIKNNLIIYRINIHIELSCWW